MIKIKRLIKPIIKENKFLNYLYYDIYIKIKSYPKKKKKIRLIQKNGFELLDNMHNILNREKIDFFIDFGTLLGIIREDGFIKHDLDMDIGVIKENEKTTSRVKESLLGHGCVLKHEYKYKGNVVEQSFLFKKIKFDICYYEQDKVKSKCYLFYRDSEENIKYTDNSMSVVQMTYDKIKGIEKYKVGTHEFNIPVDAEKLLEEKYGPDWRIPNSKWIYWKSPSATKCEGFGIQEVYN